MARTLIGITTYGRNEAGHFHLPSEYIDSIRRAGGTAVMLPPGEADLAGWLEAMDGLVLTGGGDIGPEHYGGVGHEATYMVDQERDGTELGLVREVLDCGLPTLAICRGTQLVNVVLGGTLFEHLPDVVGDRIAHRLPPREPVPHSIEVQEQSSLASILGATRFDAASWHHQAIDQAASGLEIVAHAPDGTIEAVEMPNHPWLHGVQWHPELTAASDPTQQNLFDALIDRAQTGTRKVGTANR